MWDYGEKCKQGENCKKIGQWQYEMITLEDAIKNVRQEGRGSWYHRTWEVNVDYRWKNTYNLQISMKTWKKSQNTRKIILQYKYMKGKSHNMQELQSNMSIISKT